MLWDGTQEDQPDNIMGFPLYPPQHTNQTGLQYLHVNDDTILGRPESESCQNMAALRMSNITTICANAKLNFLSFLKRIVSL